MQSQSNQGGVQHRPLFPDDDDDDDFDNLDDLQFHSAVDTNVVQSIPEPETKGEVNAHTGQVNMISPSSSNNSNKMETFEMEGPCMDLPPPQLGQSSSQIPHPTPLQDGSTPLSQQRQAFQDRRSSAEEYLTGVRDSISTTWSESRLGQALKDSAHPIPCVFHCLFKILALFFYIFGGWFAGASNFVTITVVCIILLACDFWVVKNITGR
jgi:hypothetical protein